jgi:hypothetical protein
MNQPITQGDFPFDWQTRLQPGESRCWFIVLIVKRFDNALVTFQFDVNVVLRNHAFLVLVHEHVENFSIASRTAGCNIRAELEDFANVSIPTVIFPRPDASSGKRKSVAIVAVRIGILVAVRAAGAAAFWSFARRN